jgi:hypothetical protein
MTQPFYKQCKTCHETKQSSLFYVNRKAFASGGKLFPECIECTKKRSIRHYYQSKQYGPKRIPAPGEITFRVCAGPCKKELELNETNFYVNSPNQRKRMYQPNEKSYYKGRCRKCERNRANEKRLAIKRACQAMRRISA